MQPSRPPLTEPAVLFIGFALTALLVGVAAGGLSAVEGDLRLFVLGAAFSGACAYLAAVYLRATRRAGWRRRPGEDDLGGGWQRGGDRPSTPPPVPGGEPCDWDRFTAEFWSYVDARERAVSSR